MLSKTMRFEILLEAVPDVLLGMDQRGMIRFVNPQPVSRFGYDRDDLIGQPVETMPEPPWQICASQREDYFADCWTWPSGLDLELSGRQRDRSEFPAISLSHIGTGDGLLDHGGA